MALQKSIETEIGVNVNYHKIHGYSYGMEKSSNSKDQTVLDMTVTIASYISAETKDSGCKPVYIKPHKLKVIVEETKSDYIQIYNALLETEMFSGAVKV
jgi:aryl-phospho-beta-D-glucosidase BglC (GH1 family)